MHFANCAVGAFVAGSDYQLRAKRGQNPLPFVRRAIRQAKFNGKTQRRADHRVGDAGVSAGRINDGLASSQRAARDTRMNHAKGRPILYGSARIKPLGLGTECSVRKFVADALHLQQRRIPNVVEQGFPYTAGPSPFPNL